ncbi:MAG: hypothetical protein J6T08_02560 [Lentisphaeria bacterium]|nr:hypothetical protein [Lentisphaeria bacterium]
MSRIPLLPIWTLPSMPAVYESESYTAIEMVAIAYGKMRELIADYNTFAESVNNEIRSFVGSSEEEIANFKQTVEQRLICKFNDFDAHLSRIRLEMKQYTDTTLEKAFDAFGATVKAYGESIALTDATNEKIRGLSIYGKTTQRWVPVPEYPADLLSVGNSGSVAVKITNGTDEQLLQIATPEGLPGIPVTDGGNYTDATGQQWICDEIDLKRGVYVQNLATINLAKIPAWYRSTGWSNKTAFHVPFEYGAKPVEGYETKANLLCNRLSVESAGNIAMTSVNTVGIGGTDKLYISIQGIETSEALVKYLKEHETVMLYQMETKKERPLTTAELAEYKQLHTYMPDTTISNDSGADMAVEYVCITQRYLENHIHDQAVQIAREMVTKALENGEIVVGLAYNEETESAEIIAGGAE